MALAQRRYGRLPLAAVMAPAIALARDGFEVSWALCRLAQERPEPAGEVPVLGTGLPSALTARCQVPAIDSCNPSSPARSTLIAEQGPDAFYKGAIADLIAAEMARSGGLITKADLSAYTPRERPPIIGSYRGHRVVSMPPPSSGGIALVQLLNILEGFPLGDYGHNSSRAIHLVAEAARRVYADRSEWLGDPDFFTCRSPGCCRAAMPTRCEAESPRPARRRAATSSPGQPRDFEHSETTHYSVVDADGNAVATTTTLNGSYGNGQVVTGAGFLLNNEMDDFSAKPGTPNMFGLVGGEANAVAPGKRMLSSMTPTILVKDGKTRLVVGSPGGSRIITTVLQVVLNVVDFKMNVQEAVDAPRFHHQWLPDAIRLERQGFPADVVTALEAMGHSTEVGDDMGDVHAIMIDPATGLRLGASDPRLDGRTLGY